jgi:hypothetical protein
MTPLRQKKGFLKTCFYSVDYDFPTGKAITLEVVFLFLQFHLFIYFWFNIGVPLKLTPMCQTNTQLVAKMMYESARAIQPHSEYISIYNQA